MTGLKPAGQLAILSKRLAQLGAAKDVVVLDAFLASDEFMTRFAGVAPHTRVTVFRAYAAAKANCDLWKPPAKPGAVRKVWTEGAIEKFKAVYRKHNGVRERIGFDLRMTVGAVKNAERRYIRLGEGAKPNVR